MHSCMQHKGCTLVLCEQLQPFPFCCSFFSLWFVLLLCVCVCGLSLGSLLTGLGFKDGIFEDQRVRSLPSEPHTRTNKNTKPPPRLKHMGSPAYVGTWLGESLNGFLRGIAAAAHRCTWHSRVLQDFRVAYTLPEERRRLSPLSGNSPPRGGQGHMPKIDRKCKRKQKETKQ